MTYLRYWRAQVLWFTCLAIALISWRFLVFGVELSMPVMAPHLDGRSLALYAHIGLAPVALALVPFQFWTAFRTRRPTLHGWMGRAYGVAVLLAGVAGCALSFHAATGAVAGWGFGLLAVLWLGVTGYAVRLAMSGQIAAHRRWMIRSAALTFAAVTLRIELPILIAVFGFETGYPIVAWLCWMPNAVWAELWLRRATVTERPS